VLDRVCGQHHAPTTLHLGKRIEAYRIGRPGWTGAENVAPTGMTKLRAKLS